jgi:IclR family acetate operon transcriptional repressor
MTAEDSIGVLHRITAIFETLGENDRGIGISELASRAGLPKSTVSRLVSDLVGRHYLEREGTTIRLGLRLFELGKLAKTPQQLRRAALPVMAALRDETGADVALMIRDGADMVCIAVVRGWSAHGAAERIGERTPTHGSAAGRAALTRSSVTECGVGVAEIAAPIIRTAAGIEAALSATLPPDASVEHVASAVENAALSIERCALSSAGVADLTSRP